MAGDWNVAPLNELYEFSSGLSTPRSAFGTGYPFLSFKDVFYNTFVPEQLAELVQSTEHERARCSVRRGDVFLTRTSETMDELGMSCVALCDIPDATFNGFTKRLRPKDNRKVAPEYAGYYFRSPGFRQAVTAMSSMSTRASLNNEMLARLSITLPAFEEQVAIGHILGTLDDKIELNRRMTETLEAMARALFKSWFVDFDPVRAKAEGRAPGLPEPLADLFPCEFEDRELGEIPKGWRVRILGDVLDLAKGGVWGEDTESEESSVAMSCIRGIDAHELARGGDPDIPTRWLTPKQLIGRRVEPGDILVEGSGSFCGRSIVWQPQYERLLIHPPTFSNFCKRLVSGESSWVPQVIWMQLRTAYEAGELDGFRTGTAFPNFDVRGLLTTFSAVIPPRGACEAFAPFFDAAHNAERRLESRTLAELRDNLLPKLISGELRVRDAERFVEAAGC